MRAAQEIVKRDPGGGRDQKVIRKEKKEHRPEICKMTPSHADEYWPDESRKARKGNENPKGRMKPFRQAMRPRPPLMEEAISKKTGEKRPDERSQNRTGQKRCNLRHAQPAKLVYQQMQPARQRNRGLEPALEPASPLPKPDTELWRRFLHCRGIQSPALVAEASQPETEICILGNIPRVPPTQFAQCRGSEMIARAAKRKRPFEFGKADVQHIEQGGIFERKKPLQPIVFAAANGEPGLQAYELLRRSSKSLGGHTNLRGIGNIFCVEDDRELSSQQRQCNIERARFRPRPSRRRDKEFVRGRPAVGLQRHERVGIVFFDDDFDFEFGTRIVAALGSKLTKA
jgi:hypothetical protein